MRGRHNGYRPSRPYGGYPPSQPPLVPQNPNFTFQDPNVLQFLQSLVTPAQPNFALQQNPNNFFFPNPNAYSLPQNPNIPTQQQPQQVFNNPSSSQSQLHNQRGSAASGQVPTEVQERADQAVKQAWQELFASRNSVTAWKVSEAALVALRADSWSSLGLDMQGIPSFQKLMTIEGRVNAFIQCFVGVRRITTLYELEMAICENERVRTYDKLELGPLLRHPLVLHYFSLSSNCTVVYKITSEDVIAHLHEYMDSHKSQEILIDEFLDFVADKQAATSKGELGVRIWSLAMYTSFIKKAKSAERKKDFEVKKGQKGLKVKKHCKGLKLKERYMNISQQVESFMSVNKDFCGKHIRFDSSSSEEEDSNDSAHENERNDHGEGIESELPSEVISSSDRVSRCPYPSATEELIRLGLKERMDKPSPTTASSKHNDITGPYKRKRKIDSPSPSVSRPPKLIRTDGLKQAAIPNENGNQAEELSNLDEADILLSDNLMKTFITTWQEACREHTLAEVLQRMLCFYHSTARKRNRMKSMLSSYPFIGLLNVAVMSIKKGMWDSIYDTIQGVRKFELTNTSDNYSEHESIDVEPSKKGALIPTSIDCVTVEDVFKKINAYFQLNHEVGKSLKEQKFVLLRKLFNCESWLAEQFHVKGFKSLGLGEFFMFLERHASLLPIELQKLLAADICEKSTLEVCFLQHQLIAFMSQASYNLQDNQIISKEVINALLMKQYPLINFKVKENGSIEDFLEVVEKSKNDVSSKCVIFSASLLGMFHNGDSLAYDENYSSETSIQNVRKVKSTASKDAMAVLLRAPMLSDLYAWSHWDVLFAPSLGSLIMWLLNEVSAKELLCLVTKDGKVVRINHSATVDSFLEAALNGSAFETALMLLSLCSLTGGIKHLPLALLKHHAQMAFEVRLKNHIENIEVDEYQNSIMNGKASFRPKFLEDISVDNLGSGLQMNSIKMNKAASHASRFFLDCLCYLPSEFRGCAADILLYGMRAVIKDWPSAILSECYDLSQRVVLHELGFSLGIVEWIQDYHAFCSADMSNMFPSYEGLGMTTSMSDLKTRSNSLQNVIDNCSYAEKEPMASGRTDKEPEVCDMISCEEVSAEKRANKNQEQSAEIDEQTDAALVIESIRRDEFGLNPSLSGVESSMLKKQHARLGRALHCLSQELYSQDSHFLLELVQNADDNVYSESEEPTLSFILQESGIIVLNNELGFSAENIRALCDVGSSTKKGCSGYIGKKGIGFKSVFRVTDAPEIHSNGFHVKFDISDGQIGFVLPTLVPPCNVDSFRMLLGGDTSHLDNKYWSTCIILPFRSFTSEGKDMNNIVSMFSDLHPSLLLFLHRLQCIVFRNMLNNSFVVMRKEIVGNGIVKVSCGVEKMTWFVASQKLQADIIHRDVQISEISIALSLQETDGCYRPFLDQQPVFAFLPLRTYGLKFILQGDFVLPSSREEVDVDSPWNQWLLSQYPSLFVSVERLFCSLPCFKENLGKAVSVYMSFVPLVGEVHGFFSSLPRMIISKLRMSNCLILEGDKSKWVPSCKVLRGWSASTRKLFPDSLLHEHLGLGYLDKDIILSDPLARALGIQDYGPEVLVQIISSLCQRENGLKHMGLAWISSWLNEFYTISFHSSGQASMNCEIETVLIENLRKTPFIPLSDGTFSSVDEGTVWLHSDAINTGFEGELGLEAFPKLYTKLRFVNPALFSESAVSISYVRNITSVLHNIGVQQLSAHEIVKVHILPDIYDERIKPGDKNLMIDYLCFVMIHLQSSCPSCLVERKHVISELRNKAFILTNYGFKRPVDVPVHFSKEFENPVNINRLTNGIDLNWHEVDKTYLKHPASRLLSTGLKKWREFFLEIGVTDFVQVVQLDRSFMDMSHTVLQSLSSDWDLIPPGSVVKDWESCELVQLLSLLSASCNHEGCKYILEILDEFWDGHFSENATSHCNFKSGGEIKPFRSTFLCRICDIPWVVSSVDDKLHYPNELFHDCDPVRAILGACAPYAVPKVRNEKLVKDIGFKTEVTLDDVLKILKLWRSERSFKASIAQMFRLYTFIWNKVRNSRQKISEEFHAASFIFVPNNSTSRPDDVVPGLFLSSKEVFWHDSTGTMDQMYNHLQSGSSVENQSPLNRTLSNIYPGLHDFFVNECKVPEKPSFCGYMDILLQLSALTLPSQAANAVFQVFLKWADALRSDLLSAEDIRQMKDCLSKSEYTVLPTVLDKWVSLHPSFGLVCWCDDEKLKKRFKHLDNIDFLYFGTLSDGEKELLQTKVSILIRTFGIPVLSEVVTREAIFDGKADDRFRASLVNWALPFAQRYLYSVHPDKYILLKQSGFGNINNLQIVVVDKLYYRNVIRSCGIVSKKEFQCTCLLQENILYTTPESDFHTIYMELSRLLFDGTSDLHLANFLHMVTTMAKSGSNEEQMELFILNSQKVSKLPDDEPIWSLSSVCYEMENNEFLESSTMTADNEESSSKSKKKTGIYSNWPPVDWKTAPGLSKRPAPISQPIDGSNTTYNGSENIGSHTSSDGPVAIDTYISLEDNIETTSSVPILLDSESLDHQYGNTCNPADSGVRIAFGNTCNPVDSGVRISLMSDSPQLVSREFNQRNQQNTGFVSSEFSQRDQLLTGTPSSAQALLTGKLGELVAFKYFTGTSGKTVKWVNKDSETGLPYDLVVEDERGHIEYVEVKATKSARKDWFNISTREWQFAAEKGDSFSIAHVFLLSDKEAKIAVYTNPIKLCQQGKLQLVVLMPRQRQDSTIIT